MLQAIGTNIFAGCTVSIILFLAGINVILEYAMLSSAPNFISSSKTALPLIRAFMDDINIMSTSVAGAQDLLARCSKALKWAGMDYRADKSRSIVIIKGKTMNTTPFTASEPANSTDFSCYIQSHYTVTFHVDDECGVGMGRVDAVLGFCCTITTIRYTTR